MTEQEVFNDIKTSTERIIQAVDQATGDTFEHNWIKTSFRNVLPTTINNLGQLLNLINRNIFPAQLADCYEFLNILTDNDRQVTESIKDILQDKYLTTGQGDVKNDLTRTVKELRDTAHEYEQHLK